jgi:phospholipase/carboxylesterase
MKHHDIANTLRFGAPLTAANGAVILIHGRGSSANDIAGLSKALKADGLAFLAPNAAEGAWYPQRFFVPLAHNEPWLTSALGVIDGLTREVHAAGIPYDRIAFAGFSQGACLTLEYVTRHPRRYGFAAGLSGALIGPLDTKRQVADLEQTPVLVACAENDAHIPLEFVEKSAVTLTSFNAAVTKQIFTGSAHTVFPDEVAWLRKQVADWAR